jgi:outer membrane lipoprotein-sorting protein
MSYEDTLNNETLEAQYNSTLVGEEEINGKQCYVLELIGKKKTIQYPKQKIWVDKETDTAVKIELYALSGAKIKEETILEVKRIGNRYFAVNSEMKDLLRKNSKTVFKMNKVELDVKLPDNIFSMKSLEK